ncbi:E3 ubiquitin-protein ligase PUB23-like [Magnolia sinica]|uniref:E3 ubiquitin-protein ligase PUB23-like n=1 Tax=Magnolia sinica TaxID=86752 RepID=UPI002659330C|nr:E3 ubiquitin-protein ligase PUB23-like [Magnolia sinica]
MDGPDIPPFFICPISLQIMKDPVTLSTGITYDRESIDRWLFRYKHNTCPVTKQPLDNHTLTPNSTLLRLIQSWHLLKSSKLILAVDPPRPTFDLSLLHDLINKVREPESQIKSLRSIKLLIQDNENNRRYVEESGIPSLIASLVTETSPQEISHLNGNSTTIEEFMNVLFHLKLSPETLEKIVEDNNGKIIRSLSSILQLGSFQARIHAALLLKSIFKVVGENYKMELHSDLFDGIAEILKDQNSNRATTATLSILISVTPFGRNRIRAIEAGIVPVLVELLAETNERRSCESMLVVLEILCGWSDGRSAFLAHPASVAAVSSKILRVSQLANERAVKVLLLVCRYCMGGEILKEMVEVGGVTKLCMVVQGSCSRKAKEKAKEILGLHFRTWKKSPCFPSCLLP